MMDCGTRNTEMNFILPHSFDLDLRGKLLSTLVELLFYYSNKILRTFNLVIWDHFRQIYLNAKRIFNYRQAIF